MIPLHSSVNRLALFLVPLAFATQSASAQSPSDTVALTNVNAAAGLTNMYTTGNTHTGGLAWVDYNNDYWPDLFITNGSGFDHMLYRNNGDGTFKDVSTLVSKPDLLLEDAGVKCGDFDNDGDTDILVIVDNPTLIDPLVVSSDVGGPNLYYVNQGNGTFVESAAGSGLVHPGGKRTSCAGLADYDRDGFLDVYLGSWAMNGTEGVTNFDRLLKGNGDGTFTDTTKAMRLDGYGRDALTCKWFDMQNDGWPDLYVGNVGHASIVDAPDNYDILYVNHPAEGYFCNETGNPRVIGDDTDAAMGIALGDIENDGDWDLYLTDLPLPSPPVGNTLYVNNGDGTFRDNKCIASGTCSTNSWPCGFEDFNRDGWVDLWVGTRLQWTADEVYLNNGNATFTLKTVSGLRGNDSKGGSCADYDGDGDVDLAIQSYGLDSNLFRNDTVVTRNWMEFKLLGTTSNTDAIGAIVKVTAGGITQMREVSGGDSAHSQRELIVHFGVDQATTAAVQIDWPSGVTQNFAGVAAGELVFVDEAQGILAETLPFVSAVYSPASQTLQVIVKSNFGGRTSFDSMSFGGLTWNPNSLTHRLRVTGVATQPVGVRLTSSRGTIFNIPVTAG